MLFFILLSCTVPDRTMEEGNLENDFYAEALAFSEQGKVDSAFAAFGKAKEIFADNRDSLHAGYCLLQMAIMQSNHGDYYGAQETSLEALSFFKIAAPSHAQYLSAIYNNIGIATFYLKSYDRAIAFYDLALRYASDSLTELTYLNNKARALHNQGEFGKAIAIYETIQEGADRRSSSYARLLTNLALARWRQDPQYDAAPDFLTALHIRERNADLPGLGASYLHLSDYYVDRYPDSAIYYARKLHATSIAAKHADDQIRALYRLIRLSSSDSAKHYFETYKILTDSVQLARAAAKNQFALIRYEVEKNKADNLRLQKENAEKVYQMTRQRMWIGAAIALMMLAAGGGIFWHRKRAQRLALEAQNRINAHRLKTSKKIHDVVANGIYRVMAEVENQEQVDREGILDRLEEMYEKSRDISYETDEPAGVLHGGHEWHEWIADLLKSFATASTKVIIVGNAPELWQDIGTEVQAEVGHVLQELMVNMRKHSDATDVVVRFQKTADQLYILYSDNGVGLPHSFKKGNGLVNTGSRIESLGGQLTFVSGGEKGLRIDVNLPIA